MSEKNVRAPIQNGIHDQTDASHFRVLDKPDKFYFQYTNSETW